MATFEIRAGDTNFPVEAQLVRRDGTLQPLAGNETIQFYITDATGTETLVGAGAISDQVNSKVRYVWLAGDTSGRRQMLFRGRFKVTFGGGGIESWPTWPDDLLIVVY